MSTPGRDKPRDYPSRVYLSLPGSAGCPARRPRDDSRHRLRRPARHEPGQRHPLLPVQIRSTGLGPQDQQTRNSRRELPETAQQSSFDPWGVELADPAYPEALGVPVISLPGEDAGVWCHVA